MMDRILWRHRHLLDVLAEADTRALMIRSPSDLAATLMRNVDRIEQLAGRRPCSLFPAACRLTRWIDVRSLGAD